MPRMPGETGLKRESGTSDVVLDGGDVQRGKERVGSVRCKQEQQQHGDKGQRTFRPCLPDTVHQTFPCLGSEKRSCRRACGSADQVHEEIRGAGDAGRRECLGVLDGGADAAAECDSREERRPSPRPPRKREPRREQQSHGEVDRQVAEDVRAAGVEGPEWPVLPCHPELPCHGRPVAGEIERHQTGVDEQEGIDRAQDAEHPHRRTPGDILSVWTLLRHFCWTSRWSGSPERVDLHAPYIGIMLRGPEWQPLC